MKLDQSKVLQPLKEVVQWGLRLGPARPHLRTWLQGSHPEPA